MPPERTPERPIAGMTVISADHTDECAEEVEQVMAVRHDPDTDMYTAVNSIDSDQDEIEATIKPGHFTSSKRQTFKRKLFPDSGASICLGGTHHLEELNISP